MNKQIGRLLLVLSFLVSCKGKNQSDLPVNDKEQIGVAIKKQPNIAKVDTILLNNAPSGITRTIIQDKKGNIWFATFEGVFKYDGNSMTHISKDLGQIRFFSALEDSNGNLWFGSIGSGVYYYDGKSFQNFTIDDGLLNNEIVDIYEDKKGNIWFGANGGTSLYDGKFFRNFTMNGNSMKEDKLGKTISNIRPINEVNSIVEDQTGKFWFGTRGRTFIYDGKTFTTVKQNGNSFTNVRTIIEDKKGNIWLGGNDGLWRYDGVEFSNITKDFVGYIYEDKKGSIWTSSQSKNGWTLSRYDLVSIDSEEREVTEVKTREGMFFGILEDLGSNIWAGTLNGAYRYNGNSLELMQSKNAVIRRN